MMERHTGGNLERHRDAHGGAEGGEGQIHRRGNGAQRRATREAPEEMHTQRWRRQSGPRGHPEPGGESENQGGRSGGWTSGPGPHGNTFVVRPQERGQRQGTAPKRLLGDGAR